MLIHIADILGSLPMKKGPAALNSGGPASNINSAILPPADSTSKQYKTLAARFAMAGHVLVQSNPAHGPVTCYATRWGMAKVLVDLDAAEAFLMQIGGQQ